MYKYTRNGLVLPYYLLLLLNEQSAYGQLCQFNVKTKGKYCVGELIFSDPFGQALTFEFEKEGGDCVTIDNPTH